MNFEELATTVAEQKGRSLDLEASLLSFDPGHTTGWCHFQGVKLMDFGQIDTTDIQKATKAIGLLFAKFQPTQLVIEDYRVYKHKTKHHAGSDLLTARVIGTLETVCALQDVPLVKQPASIAKGFCTDKKLKDWGMWQKGMKHARDAIRHACYYIIFGQVTKGKKLNKPKVG